jgi:hypothetical protein
MAESIVVPAFSESIVVSRDPGDGGGGTRGKSRSVGSNQGMGCPTAAYELTRPPASSRHGGTHGRLVQITYVHQSPDPSPLGGRTVVAEGER